MYYGIHVSSAGGIENTIKNAEKYGVNSIQIMPTVPMKWVTKPLPDEMVEAFVNELEKSHVEKILIHGIYLTNLARKDKQLFHLGKMGLVVYLDFAQRVEDEIKKRKINAEMLGVCFHPGSQKELSYEESLKRISYGIQWVLDQVKGTQKILIETTAGAGFTLGKDFKELGIMREGVEDKERVGFVVDTEHTYASGYDWVNNFEGVVTELDNEIGIKNVKAIHLNDSAVVLGSNKDRHADLGKGNLGEECITRMLHEKKFHNIPFILETPGLKDVRTTKMEVATLKRLINTK
jgi:apurinic endonuclease APN1